MKQRAKWETIGYISVDAGCIKIGDPCYDTDSWYEYATDRDAEVIPHDGDTAELARGFGAAVVLQSGLGDGVYKVEAKRDPELNVIKEVRVKFF